MLKLKNPGHVTKIADLLIEIERLKQENERLKRQLSNEIDFHKDSLEKWKVCLKIVDSIINYKK